MCTASASSSASCSPQARRNPLFEMGDDRCLAQMSVGLPWPKAWHYYTLLIDVDMGKRVSMGVARLCGETGR